jgi:signal peptidase I
MGARSTRTRQATAYVACGLVIVAWFVWLRPTTLGGQASYVVVKGSSMAPTYDDGDLVIVREESHYDQGDVIAFRAGGRFDDPTRIIHRIVGDAGGGAFVTRGDNRDQTDPWEPGPGDVIGRAVLHVPHVGDAASAAGRPAVLAALGAAALLGRRRRRRRRMTAVPGTPGPAGERPPRQPPRPDAVAPRWRRHTDPRWAFLGLLVSAVALLPVLLAGWSAIEAPDTATRAEPVGALDLGVALDYRFTGDPSPVYPTGVVGTTRNAAGGLVPTDPLYTRLLRRLEVSLSFRAAGEGADDLVGTYGIHVGLRMPEGWSTTLASIDPAPIEDVATQLLSVDLVDAAARVAQVAALTGVGGDAYTISIEPRLEVEGSADGEPVREAVAPTVAFVSDGGTITAQPVEAATAHRELAREVREPLHYGLGPISVSTQAARGLLGGLALVLLAAVAVFASVLFGGVGLGESERIAARYRSQIVDVAAATGPPGPVVMVSAIDELVRLAKVEQSVILHEDLGDGGHRYRVFLGAVTYEYETAPEHGGQAVDAASGPSGEQREL